MITKGVARIVSQDISKILGTLQAAAVSRCRERLDEAAVRAKDLMSGGGDGRSAATHERPEYGVTSVLKRRHGL